jgi:hypothetical protein
VGKEMETYQGENGKYLKIETIDASLGYFTPAYNSEKPCWQSRTMEIVQFLMYGSTRHFYVGNCW